MQVLRDAEPATSPAASRSVAGMAAAFDDAKVAQLLATALALDGQASDRLATIFNTIAPDDDRKRRVLTLTRSMLSETDFGRRGSSRCCGRRWKNCWSPTTTRPFVSDSYRTALDGVGAAPSGWRLDLPPDLLQWMESSRPGERPRACR